MKTLETVAVPSASITSYQQLLNVNKIHQAVIEDKSLEEIAKIYLDTIESLFSTKGCRLYTLNENNQLNLVSENFETKAFKLIEDRLGIKIKNQIPILTEDNYIYKLLSAHEPIVTSDPLEIRLIVEAHTTNAMLKPFSKWAINLLGLKTYGIIPLMDNKKIIGLVTFVSAKPFTREDKSSIIEYTRQVSVGLMKKISNELLLEQKKLSENILDILPIDVAIFDKYNRYTLVNKKAIKNEKIREWIIGKTDAEYCIHTDKPTHISKEREQKFKQVEKSGQAIQWIEHLLDENANQRHILRILRPLYVNHNRYKIGYGIDVSELVNTQERLKETQRIGKLGNWELNLFTGNILLADEILKILGIENQKNGITLRKFYYKIHPKYREDFIRIVKDIYKKKEVNNLEIGITSSTGEMVYFSLNAAAVIDENNIIQKLIGTFLDITDRKKNEEALKASQELLLTSEAMGKIGSWEVNFVDINDWSKNTTVWSDESYRIFGYKPGSVKVSFPFFLEHIHPDDRHLIKLNFSELFIPGVQHESEFRIVLKDNTIKHLHGKFYIQFSDKNVPVKMIGMTQDITDRKKLEHDLEMHNQMLKVEVERQTMELNIANKNLEAFNYSISHDIKTPLRAMEMYIHLLREQLETDEDGIDYVENLNMSVIEMKDMISSLLDFSKYSTIDLKKENVDMSLELRKCIDLLTKNDNDQEIEFNILDTPSISVDRVLIKNVLCNLIGNAIKYSAKKETSIIEISGSSDELHTTYYVKDNGAGFDEKYKSKLFKPFSRLHNASEFEGNGAGLAIVERIIARHGGTIWADSKKGEGATFYFRIPN